MRSKNHLVDQRLFVPTSILWTVWCCWPLYWIFHRCAPAIYMCPSRKSWSASLRQAGCCVCSLSWFASIFCIKRFCRHPLAAMKYKRNWRPALCCRLQGDPGCQNMIQGSPACIVQSGTIIGNNDVIMEQANVMIGNITVITIPLLYEVIMT